MNKTLETLFYIAMAIIGYIALSDLAKVTRQIIYWIKNKFKK
jgi:hypothetical protein